MKKRNTKMTSKKPEPADTTRQKNDSNMCPVFRLPAAIILAAAGGTAILLSFPRFDQFWLAWFAAAFMVPAFYGRRFSQAFGLGMIAGFIGNMGGFYWISNMLQEFGHMPVWLSWMITVAMITFQGVYYALAAGVSAAVTSRFRAVPWLLAFPVTYTAFEFVYPLIFPWYAGNGQQLFYPAIQIADITGAPGISFMLMFVGTAIGCVVTARMERKPFPVKVTIVAGTVFAAILTYGAIRIHQVDARVAAAPEFRVGLVEANVGIWEKEAKKPDGSPMNGREKGALLFSNLLKHQYLSRELEQKHKPDLIVWPETSYRPLKYVYVKRRGKDKAGDPDLPESIDDRSFERAWPYPTDTEKIYVSKAGLPERGSYKEPMKGFKNDGKTALHDRNAAMRGFSTPMIFGAGTIDVDASAKQKRPIKYNSALLMDGKGNVSGMYTKTRLLIFGEYLPFEKHFPFLRDWLPEAGTWTPGDGPRVFELDDAKIGVNICYEDLLAPFHRKMSRLNPNLLVNITNDAWFGKTREPWLHLQLAELRCVEARMFMARATNTGISAFVDPVGRRLSHTSMEDPEYLVADLALTSEKTFYMRFGDIFAWACCLLTALLALMVIAPGQARRIASTIRSMALRGKGL